MLFRTIHLVIWIALSMTLSAQNPAQSLLHAGDTLYLARDMLPVRIELQSSGNGQFWEMGRLLSPFVHQSLVRPGAQGTLILAGPDDVDRYLVYRDNALFLTQLTLPNGTAERIQVRFDPEVPYVSLVGPNQQWDYSGTMTVTMPDKKTPVLVRLLVAAYADATGELNTPTIRGEVIRERRDVEMSMITESRTFNPEDLPLPAGFMPGRSYFFHNNKYPVPVAIVQTDALNQAKQVEYISQPWAGQVVQQVPRQPDIFVYPNPSFGNVRFDLYNLSPGSYELEIYNILGMKLRTEQIYANGTRTLPLDLTSLKKGTYIYRLVDSQHNTVKSKRLVIITP